MDPAATVTSLLAPQAATGLADRGFAVLNGVLSPVECQALQALYDDDRRFRSRVEMARHLFGQGEYKYFAYPLPPIVQSLRTAAYAALAPIANSWRDALGGTLRFPAELPAFLTTCHAAGQSRPTPLLLRYEPGGYNALHQDVYGDVSFPLQMTIFLSQPKRDYTGGEFLLVEQRPRAQSIGHVFQPRQGDALVFPNSIRPARGRRGYHRIRVRHGVSEVRSGRRFALGVIFHDAR